MPNLDKIFTTQFLFNPTPSPKSDYYPYMLAAFGLMIVIAVVIGLVRKEDKRVMGKFFTPFLACGILGLLYNFGRYESLPWLASYFFLAIIILIFVVWVVYLSLFTVRYIPKYKMELKSELRYNRYLPKKKSKK